MNLVYRENPYLGCLVVGKKSKKSNLRDQTCISIKQTHEECCVGGNVKDNTQIRNMSAKEQTVWLIPDNRGFSPQSNKLDRNTTIGVHTYVDVY